MFSLSMKWFLITTLGLLCFLLALSDQSGAQIRAAAQHRLPPVIYSLDIPYNRIVSGWNTTISWSLVGYHDTYEVMLQLYDDTGQRLHQSVHTPYRKNTGSYTWGNIRPEEFHYRATVAIDFAKNQDITVRFFGVPPDDPIDNETFVSVIVPGGHPYRYLDGGGRQILVNGIAEEFWAIDDEFLSITDTVCGEDIAHFTAHFRDSFGQTSWLVNVAFPPGVSADFMAPTPNSPFDELLGHLSQLFGFIPGSGILWTAASYFDNEYVEVYSLSHVTGPGLVPQISPALASLLPLRIPERKLNIRLRGTPPRKDWHLLVAGTEMKLAGEGRRWGPTRIPLQCFGGPSDN